MDKGFRLSSSENAVDGSPGGGEGESEDSGGTTTAWGEEEAEKLKARLDPFLTAPTQPSPRAGEEGTVRMDVYVGNCWGPDATIIPMCIIPFYSLPYLVD